MNLKYLFIIIFVFSVFVSFSQKNKEQADLIAKSEKLFNAKDYKSALPLFSQLLSLYPSEPLYSFYYGACLVENNKQIDKAIKYLAYGTRKLNDQPLAFYYLGRAYHLSYQFDKAITQYKIFKSKAPPKLQKEIQIEREINICNNGLTLIKYVSPLIVLNNKKIKKNNFHYSYDMKEIGGKLVVKPDVFKTKFDKKRNAKELIFINDEGTVFFSSLGNKKNGNRDIYWTKKNENGQFLPSQSIGSVINTSFDEDYPFLKADGKTLYFCSKGHNTIGGYDIFKSVYDSTSSAWSPPVNLDFPTNTPYDDLLYVVDSSENIAYFASNRESHEGKVNVYKIQVDKHPVERSPDNIEEIQEIAKLNVTPLADLQKKDTLDTPPSEKKEIAVATTKVAEFKEEAEADFSFDKVYDKNVSSSDDYTHFLRNDLKHLEQQLARSEAKSHLIGLSAQEKLNKLNQLQTQIEEEQAKQSYEEQQYNTDLIDLVSEATKLNTQTQIATKTLKAMEEEIKLHQKEIKITRMLLNDSANNNTQELVQNIDANRKFINQNKRKYLSIPNWKKERQNEKKDLNQQIERKKQTYNTQNTKFSNLLADYKKTEIKLKNTKDPVQKEEIRKSLITLKEELSSSQSEVVETQKELSRMQNQALQLNNEIAYLNQINTKITDPKSLNSVKSKAPINSKQIIDQAKKNDEIISSTQDEYAELLIENTFNEKTSEIFNPENDLLLAEQTPVEETTEETAKAPSKEETETKTETEIVAQENPEQTTEEVTNTPSTSDENGTKENKITEEEKDNLYIAEQKSNNPKETSSTSDNKEQEIKQTPDIANEDNYIEPEATTKTKKEIQQVDLVQVHSLEARKKYNEAQNNAQLSDSLFSLAAEKENQIKQTKDIDKKEVLRNEVSELKQLSKIKATQSLSAFQDAQIIEEDFIVQNQPDTVIEDLIKQNIFSFESKQNDSPELVEYKKAAFKEQYYQQEYDKIQTQKKAIERALNETKLSAKARKNLKSKIEALTDKEEQFKDAVEDAKDTQDQMKSTLIANNETYPISKEEVYAAATEKKLNPNIPLSTSQKKTLKTTTTYRTEANELISSWDITSQEIKALEDSLLVIKNKAVKNELSKEINSRKHDAWINYKEANELQQYANMKEENILDSLLNTHRTFQKNKQSSQAYVFEKESELLLKKADVIRESAKPSDTYDPSIAKLLKKAQLYETIAINRQKAALDIYTSITPTSTIENDNQNTLAENNSNKDKVSKDNTPDDEEETKEAVYVELLPNEEEKISEYQKLYTQSESKMVKADNALLAIEKNKKKLENTYTKKEKKKLEAKIAKQEEKVKLAYHKAYSTQQKANEEKYDLYHQKTTNTLKAVPDKTQKLISEQYLLDAEFYHQEAQKIHIDSSANINNLKAQYLRKLSLEQEALKAQELAFTSLTQSEDKDEIALSLGSLIKIDPIESSQKPIDKELIQKVQSKRILEKLDLTSQEAKKISSTEKFKEEKIKLNTEYLANQEQIKVLKDSLNKISNSKQQSKIKTQIADLEAKSTSYLINIVSISEPIHYEKFTAYKNHIKSHRIKGKSEKAVTGRTLEKDANKAFRKAQSLRSRSLDASSAIRAYEMLQKADALEVSALDNMEKAYTIYMDLAPIEEDVNKYIAEHTDTNKTDALGYTLVESEGEVESIETPVDIEKTATTNKNDKLAENTTNESKEEQSSDENINTSEIADTNNNNSNELTNIEESETNEIDIVDTNNQKNDKLAENTTSKTNESKEEQSSDENINTSEIADANNSSNEITNIEESETNEIDIVDTNNQKNDKIAENTTNKTNESKEEQSSDENINISEIADANNSSNEITNIKESETNETTEENTIQVESFASMKPIIIKGKKSVYNKQNPIPVDIELPQGISYKIQIGAFTKPIPQNSFRGLTPVTGETRQNSKYTRYFVGLFSTFDAAKTALPLIKNSGYRDAFIVAYKNGERVPMYIARKENKQQSNYQELAQKETQMILETINNNPEPNSNDNSISNSDNSDDISYNDNSSTDNITEDNLSPQEMNPSVNIKEINETFYTVQIGAYNQPVSHSRLKNLNPLYNQTNNSGLILYFVGKFVNYNDANSRKIEIRQIGIKDAFVTAFKDGQKIPITQARRELSSINNSSVIIDDNPTAADKLESNNTNTNKDKAIKEEKNKETALFNTETVHYRIQIGAYINQVPVEVVSSFVQLTKSKEIETFNLNNRTIYTIGHFTSLTEASKFKTNLVDKGITDAFIIAYDGQVKVKIDEAKQFLNP